MSLLYSKKIYGQGKFYILSFYLSLNPFISVIIRSSILLERHVSIWISHSENSSLRCRTRSIRASPVSLRIIIFFILNAFWNYPKDRFIRLSFTQHIFCQSIGATSRKRSIQVNSQLQPFCAEKWRIEFIRSSKGNGFVKIASNWMFSKYQGVPEIPMIGVQGLSEVRMWLTTSRPFSPGIRMSVITKSNRPLLNFWTPSLPFKAISILKPALDNTILMIFNISFSSSMTKIWYITSPSLWGVGTLQKNAFGQASPKAWISHFGNPAVIAIQF